jgi:hypothetical protein
LAGKLWFKKIDDTNCSIVLKAVKDDGASEKYVRRATIEKLSMKGVVLQVRDSSWMMVDSANDWVYINIKRQYQLCLKLKLGDDG